MFPFHAQAHHQRGDESSRFRLAVAPIVVVLRAPLLVAPDGPAIGPPIATQCPAWQLLAGIPFSLTVMQQGARGESIRQAAKQFARQSPFVSSEGRRVPFGPI